MRATPSEALLQTFTDLFQAAIDLARQAIWTTSNSIVVRLPQEIIQCLQGSQALNWRIFLIGSKLSDSTFVAQIEPLHQCLPLLRQYLCLLLSAETNSECLSPSQSAFE